MKNCNLTSNAANTISDLIKHQAMRRHNEAWQDSLRYRRPDLDQMNGVRRITMNNNVLIGDTGAILISNALRDDLWVKAVDLQHCGVTEMGAKALLEVLRFNTALIILDVRRNPINDSDILDRISEQILINSDGRQSEFKWIEIPETPKSNSSRLSSSLSAKRKKRLKQLNSSIQKTSIRINSASSTPRKRSSSADNVKSGIPWRTAARASRYKSFFSETPQSSEIKLCSTSDNDYSNVNDKEFQKMKTELCHLTSELQLEQEARKGAEKQILDLKMQLEKVKTENEELKEQGIDNEMLDNIGTTFDQFHNFIDMLRENGLGKIVEMAGLNNFSNQQN